MANESIVYGLDATKPSFAADVAVVTTGGTLTGNNDIELRILKATFAETDNKGFNNKVTVLQLIDRLRAAVAKEDYPAGGLV
jgi:hypothetical protein